MGLSVKVYKMLGSFPTPTTDIYLGNAVDMGSGVFNFNMPIITEDHYHFYYYGTDIAGNSSTSNIQIYYNGTESMMYKTTSGDEFASLNGYTDELLIKLRT